MTPGQKIFIKAEILRIDGERVHAQTPDGQLIQTAKANVFDKSQNRDPSVGAAPTRPLENKAVKNAPENKSK